VKDIQDKTETERIIVAGFGGQGIMLAGKLLIQAGLAMGREVTYIPSYGAEVRGGTAHCHVIISASEIASPVIVDPGACLVMNSPSLAKFKDRVQTGGIFLINRSLAEEPVERKDVTVVGIKASEIAEKLGSVKAANIVMLGAYLKYSRLLTLQALRLTLETFLPSRHRDLLEINLKALQSGYELE
jgi:2-oxoglutarate ferredoxin oxidoreductase subunit gamma